MRIFSKKMRAEDGQGLVEYALILVLISIVCLIALTNIGTGINSVFTTIAATL